MFKLKRVLVFMLVLSFLVTITAGCAGNSTDTKTTTAAAGETTAGTTAEIEGATTTAAKEDIKIAMTWWGDTVRNEVYNKVIDQFEAANPNIKVDRPFGTWAEYFDKLSTQIAGGNAPDVIGMHQRYVSEYALRGTLYNLQEFVDSGVLDLTSIPESIVDTGYVAGTLYMVSQGVTGSGVTYNTSAFDKLAVSYPDMDWTWDDYAQTLKDLKKGIDAQGLDMWPSADLSPDIYNFSYWVRANKENLFTEAGELGFTEETATSWFQFWKDMRDQELIPDAATVTEFDGLPLEQSLFATGKLAVAGMAASQIGNYQKLVTDDGQINILRFPHIEGNPNPEYLSGAFFTVNAKSENPEAAALLINFFINNTEAQKTFKIEQGVPAATTAIEAITASLSDSEKKSMEYIQNQLVKYATPEPYPPTGYTEISTNFKTIAMSVAFGEKTPAEAAADLMSTSAEVLSR